MPGSRWVVGIGAFLVAILALYMLLRFDADPGAEPLPVVTEPALDEIDDASREKMRELLREDGREG